MSTNKVLDEKELEQVTGGAGMEVNPHEDDFDKAWFKLNMDAQYSQMSRDEYYLEWKSYGFVPDAEDFLKTKIV